VPLRVAKRPKLKIGDKISGEEDSEHKTKNNEEKDEENIKLKSKKQKMIKGNLINWNPVKSSNSFNNL